MGKKLLITGIVLIVLILIGVIGFFWLTGSPTVKAQLLVEQGVVLVNDEVVHGHTKLGKHDVVVTQADALATIIIHESIIINIDPDTAITVADLAFDHPQLDQSSGSSWSTFTGLWGVEEYSISTPDTVASVRGTALLLEDFKVLTGEGDVAFEIEGTVYRVTDLRVVEQVNGSVVERAATDEEIALIETYRLRAVAALKQLRLLEVDKHPHLISMAEPMVLGKSFEITPGQYYTVPDETPIDFEGIFAKVDALGFDLHQLEDEVPFGVDALTKVADITDAIRDLEAAN